MCVWVRISGHLTARLVVYDDDVYDVSIILNEILLCTKGEILVLGACRWMYNDIDHHTHIMLFSTCMFMMRIIYDVTFFFCLKKEFSLKTKRRHTVSQPEPCKGKNFPC